MDDYYLQSMAYQDGAMHQQNQQEDSDDSYREFLPRDDFPMFPSSEEGTVDKQFESKRKGMPNVTNFLSYVERPVY